MEWESRSLIEPPDPHVREWQIAGVSLLVSALVVFVGGVAWWWGEPGVLASAALFTAGLLGILVVHEGGHWVVARLHRIEVGPPVFLPIGVIIRLREAPRTRTGLLEMGAAGPLAGVVAIVAVLAARLRWGGALSAPDPRLALEGPLLWQLLAATRAGPVPAPSAGDPLVAAACMGCLITALNLLPWGQLDGGHVFAALWPERAGVVGWGITAILLLGGFWWPGWAIWAALLHLVGTRFPLRVRREGEAPRGRARWVAVAVVGAWLLCFTPAPIAIPG